MSIITIELNEVDAYRLLWLTQREAGQGRIWDRYWETLAKHIHANIMVDLEIFSQITAQESLVSSFETTPAPIRAGVVVMAAPNGY